MENELKSHSFQHRTLGSYDLTRGASQSPATKTAKAMN